MNTATQKEIECYLDIPYQIKQLYRPQIVIIGMEEFSVPYIYEVVAVFIPKTHECQKFYYLKQNLGT